MSSLTIHVNLLAHEELRSQLALVPRLSIASAEAILRLRPFADEADLRDRVNKAVNVPNNNVGRKVLALFSFAARDGAQLDRTRNVDYARENFGLHIEVAYSAWDGWPVGSDYQRGIVWDFDTHKFTIRFPPTNDWVCDDIGRCTAVPSRTRDWIVEFQNLRIRVLGWQGSRLAANML